MTTKIGHGFIAPTIEEHNYVLGAQKLPEIVLQDNGQWLKFLPEGEIQARKEFDTYGCTIYNTLKPIQIYEKRAFGEDNNYAERFTYVVSGTKPPGNDPHTIGECVRGTGLLADELLPFATPPDDPMQTLAEYASPNPMIPEYLARALQWKDQKDFGHEWVFTGGHDLKEKQERIMHGLRLSALGVSVDAWQEKNGIYYKDSDDNHWTTLVGYERNHYWIVFDSYEPFLKRLEWNYDFGFAKRYHIARKPQIVLPPKFSLLRAIQAYFANILT